MTESTQTLSQILDDLAIFNVPRKPAAMRRAAVETKLPPMNDDEYWSRGESTGDSDSKTIIEAE